MYRNFKPITVRAEEFELEVYELLNLAVGSASEPKIQHRELLNGPDGEYEIDITVRFEYLGVEFLVIVECKHHKNPIKREVVQILHDKLRSIKAHKGIIYSTSVFQKGAIEYAQSHGIALITFIEGKSTYFTKSMDPAPEPPPWANIPKYSGWLLGVNNEGAQTYSLVSRNQLEYLQNFLLKN